MLTMEKPGLEETYSRATNATDLTVEADRGGAGDVLIAAGWSPTRLGQALLRLHSEWDGVEHPPKPTPESVKALVGTYQRNLPGVECRPKKPLDAVEALQFARAWYRHELGLLFGKLKEFQSVRDQVAQRALLWGMGRPQDPDDQHALGQAEALDAVLLARLQGEFKAVDVTAVGGIEAGSRALVALEDGQREIAVRAEARQSEASARAREKAAAIVRFWLDQTCSTCHGLGQSAIPGTPALSGKLCRPCGGAGTGAAPHGSDGRRLLNYMDDCVQRARESMGRRLRATRM